MPYERREHPVPRAINYHRVYSRKNWQKRWELRNIYERVLLGRAPYNGSVIHSTPTESSGHQFYLGNTFIMSVEVAYPLFKPTLHFARTDYNKFRLFLRNIGIKATGRKHITTIRLPTGESLRFDHLKGLSYSYPPIRFLFRREEVTEPYDSRLDGAIFRTGSELQQNTFTIPWNEQGGISTERQALYSTLTQAIPYERLFTRLSQEAVPSLDALRYTLMSIESPRQLFTGLNQGTEVTLSQPGPARRLFNLANVQQQVYSSTIEQQFFDAL